MTLVAGVELALPNISTSLRCLAFSERMITRLQLSTGVGRLRCPQSRRGVLRGRDSMALPCGNDGLPNRPSGRVVLLALVSYAFGVAVATYPMVLGFASKVPNLGDPLEHLWIMRWY